MTQVSRAPLREEVWDRIYNLLLRSILKAGNIRHLENLLGSLLAPTEEIMIVKRLAIAVLLVKGQDYDSIRKILKVTPNTIAKVKFHLDNNEYLADSVERIITRDKTKAFWEEIKNLLDVPGKGKNWSEVGKRKFKRREKIYRLKHEA